MVGATAPSYDSGGNFMRGTLTRITIGDLLYRQTGFISNLSLSWNNSYQWEINDLKIEDLQGLPHLLDISVQFTPIHTFNVKSDLNLKDEKYFGRRTLKEPEKKKIPKQKIKVKKKITTETPKIELTPASVVTDINKIGGVPIAITDQVTGIPQDIGTDAIRAADAKKQNLGQKGIYLFN